MDFAGAVRRDDDDRAVFGAQRADFGDRDLEIRQQFEQETFKFFVGAVKLVDQQHRARLVAVINRLQQRALEQKFFREDVVGDSGVAVRLCLPGLNFEQLARIIPLVNRVVDVQPFVALQANQRRIQDLAEDFGDFGFSDARFAFQENRFA